MSEDFKNCQFCGEEIKKIAIKCRFCHELLNVNEPESEPEVQAESEYSKRLKRNFDLVDDSDTDLTLEYIPKTNRERGGGLAALISLIIPGAGQIFNGHILSGFCWLVLTPLGYLMLFIPGLILHILCVFSAASQYKKQ